MKSEKQSENVCILVAKLATIQCIGLSGYRLCDAIDIQIDVCPDWFVRFRGAETDRIHNEFWVYDRKVFTAAINRIHVLSSTSGAPA